MDDAQAISLVLERIQSSGADYPAGDLTADRFDGGWCVYAPIMLADDADLATRSVFLVSETGRVEEVSSDAPVEEATEWFEEACIWFSASGGPGERPVDSGLPAHPDLGGSSRPRPRAGYDREAVDVLARALTEERDFGGWLAGRLRELADLLGGGSRLIARRPDAWAAHHLMELVEPHDGQRTDVWRDWPAVDPASLPTVDTTGWVLIPLSVLVQFLEELESTPDHDRALAETVAERADQAPRWVACGVAELMPQLVATRRTDWFDEWAGTLHDLTPEDHDILRMLVTPGDADIEALLRTAVDAELNHREVIDTDATTTAAYRRVLDRLDLPFENYAVEAMFE